MRRPFILFLSVLCALFVVAAPAIAVEADEVAAAAANDGFYVERGASISEQQAGDLVARLRDAGEGFVLVVLSNEPAAGATTFADNVQFAMGRGIVLVIAPESLGYTGVGDVFDEADLENALEAAASNGGSDYDLAAAFVSELTGTPVVTPATPVPVPTTVAAPAPTTQQPATSSGGGGSGFLWFILIVGGGLFLWWMFRRAKARSKPQPADDGNLAKARHVIQEQLNDVANDILAMEDEVRVADNDRADRFYQQASRAYNDVSEVLPETKTAQGLLDLSNKLDAAIWQLDSAEAILDNNPLPERPEPKRLEPAPTPGRTPDRTTAPPPRATVPGPSSYQRRPTRKSSPGGGGLMDLLIMVGGAVASGRRKQSTRRPNSGRPSGGGLGGGLG
ncbi:MAG: hypothetical protein GY720_02410, partial [bacterium]|nr:hypothetical protein [bacterium]